MTRPRCANPPALSSASVALLVLAAAVVAGAACADTLPTTPQGWLERMSQSLRSRSFEGTFVYLHSGHLETMRIFHEAEPDGGERERVVALNGPARQVIRDDQEVTCILPDRHSVVVEKRRPRLPFPITVSIDPERLRAYYRFRMFGRHRVAGREAQAVAIDPRDRFRYGYHLYMDLTTGLPLESVVLDEGGRRVERILFTSLKLTNDIPPQELSPPPKAIHGFTFYRQENQEAPGVPASNPWTLGSLPAGFRQILFARRMLPGSRNPVEHLVLSDGLASVSVYIEKPAGGREFLRGASHMGAVHAYGRMLDGYQVTVVGEVPAATVRAVSDALQFNPGDR